MDDSPKSSDSNANELDCLECGACCRCFPIFVSDEDGEREPLIKENGILERNFLRTEKRAYRLYPLPFHDGCPFLQEDNRCRIYETRPSVCRQFAVGSAQCLEARKRKGVD